MNEEVPSAVEGVAGVEGVVGVDGTDRPKESLEESSGP